MSTFILASVSLYDSWHIVCHICLALLLAAPATILCSTWDPLLLDPYGGTLTLHCIDRIRISYNGHHLCFPYMLRLYPSLTYMFVGSNKPCIDTWLSCRSVLLLLCCKCDIDMLCSLIFSWLEYLSLFGVFQILLVVPVGFEPTT